MSVSPLLPRWLLDLGFDVRQVPDGRWLAGHIDPHYGDHAATYGAYASAAEAVAVIWSEARSAGALHDRR